LRGLALKTGMVGLFSVAPDLASAGQFGVQVAVDAGDHHVKKFDLGAAWEPGLYGDGLATGISR
jgi:lipid A 3-O-deacylase